MARPKDDRWVPLRRSLVHPASAELVRVTAQKLGSSEDDARARLEAEECEYWLNDIYQVARYDRGAIVQLNIRRRDGRVIMRDWRHFQRIKNQLVGPECEGVELYPAESRLSDTANKYHIWCVVDPTYRFPFGFQDRDVQQPVATTSAGARQRKMR